MSIRDQAYTFCKSVKKSPVREEIKQVLFSLNFKTEDTITDRTDFGYLARQYQAQVLGYLLVDQQKNELANAIPLSSLSVGLSGEEKELLRSVHRKIIELNLQIVAGLIRDIPECTSAVNPYSRFQNVSVENAQDIFLYEEAIAIKLVEAFQQHPAIRLAAQSHLDMSNHGILATSSNQPLSEIIAILDQRLLNATPLHAPRDMMMQQRISRPGTAEYSVFRYLCALISIRASLGILDELLYQALLRDKLQMLDESNIITIPQQRSTFVGDGLSIIFQSNEKLIFPELGLILLKHQQTASQVELCKVENIHMRYRRDFGETGEAMLRVIDRNLNPYSRLLSPYTS